MSALLKIVPVSCIVPAVLAGTFRYYSDITTVYASLSVSVLFEHIVSNKKKKYWGTSSALAYRSSPVPTFHEKMTFVFYRSCFVCVLFPMTPFACTSPHRACAVLK